MKIIYIASGAANMYCGSCMHDNALAAALKAAGEDVSLFPLYTPMRLDEENVGERQIFCGGIKAYLLQKYPRPFFGRDLLLRAAGSQAILRLMPHFDIGSAVDPVANSQLTISMLKGEDGNQRELLQELVSWIRSSYQPDIVHITNTLLIGVAREFKRSLQVPITCGLHGEDIFLEGMPQPYQSEALSLIRERGQYVDRFLAISSYYAEMFSGWVGLDRSKIHVVWPGIALNDYRNMAAKEPVSHPLTIGYLARFVPEKGLHLLVDAFIHLYRSGEFPDLQLIAGGYQSRAYKTYIDGIRKTIKQNGLEHRIKLLGTLERAAKLNFFSQINVFSVPATYRELKGISILEALASGVPAPTSAEPVTITFLHTNDVYELLPIKGRGGFAELMTVLKQERAKAEKRAGRVASEGRIVCLVAGDGRSGAMLELNSETDFVSRNDRLSPCPARFPIPTSPPYNQGPVSCEP